ncbi:MAG: ATP-binding cassette domain-containing protein [Candidatus Kapabacteria bacterium]|nr:ATP-binding cassette domain-containing protein [Candidatus Kapabacteria bacterium]
MVRSLVAGYEGGAIAVGGVDLELCPGELVAVGGLNGAGKTTLLRCIAGSLRGNGPQVLRGHIVFDGRDITRLPPWARARLGIAFVPDTIKIFPTLTVEENLEVPVPCTGSRSEGAAVLDLIYNTFPVLAHRRRILAGYLSGGERQMLAVSMALLQRPSLLLVDELSLGLAPGLAIELSHKLVRLKEQLGLTVLWVDQFLELIAPLSEKWIVMRNGLIAGQGDGHGFRREEAMELMYGW